ncbi:hypothetical protein T310_1411 [Rasamsonia emersonii CBS 393.64]|uniref:Uncharacterized protein n=1 Tax=Rasamsonia emersonii (strain ATCC 16479 / CBS 393.64 / IMI 116815) TaxID=1408163 RepID=A0A0F4Z2B3_RASE3|nr:hypothetical protein T310_1411 [Rasamsonia emersonii CBS 393.64]KKA24510.1 hypothetical protein T310_1411 [Rasamsonia emersonii CBS 393.64]
MTKGKSRDPRATSLLTLNRASSGRRCSPTRTGRAVDRVLVNFCSVGIPNLKVFHIRTLYCTWYPYLTEYGVIMNSSMNKIPQNLLVNYYDIPILPSPPEASPIVKKFNLNKHTEYYGFIWTKISTVQYIYLVNGGEGGRVKGSMGWGKNRIKSILKLVFDLIDCTLYTVL